MTLFSWLVSLPAISALALLGSVAFVSFYRTFLHPLARIPGPRLAAVSNVWYAYQVRSGNLYSLAKTLHQIYGPAVRVGPNEVWFDSKEAFRCIYGSGNGFEKSDFYLAAALHKPKPDWLLRMHFPDTLDLLADRDMRRYRLQRRLIGPLYQTSNLKKFEGAIDTVVERVVAQIKTLNGAEVDLKEWMHILVVECLGAVVLSWSPGYLRDKSDHGSGSQAYLGWKRKSVFGLFPVAVPLASLSRAFGRTFGNVWGLTYKTPQGFKPFFPFVQQRASRRINAALRPKPPKDDRKDLILDLIRLHQEKPEFSHEYLRRMAITNFGAGHETTTSALTAALAMIGSTEDTQRQIFQEVLRVDHPMQYDDAIRLEYTHACIKEAQRLHPVIGMSLPRKAPGGGLSVHGYYIPAGTTVGCNPTSLHRNEDIFGADPDKFNPDRWLGGTRAMERYNLTWGGGARTCPGRHLAELILFKAVPALIKEFEIEASMPPEDEIQYYFMAMLTRVKVRFLPRDQDATGHDEK